ncbi:MAG: MerR family transcriptional regulator [Bacteroidetes bacterium]|nr:MAG: MerR family transcriptional regulator [Bacteroidota bacterium]
MKQEEEIKKQYYTIGEVARELDLSTSLIRFWETEFKEIKPKKNRKGNRLYTPRDIEILQQIKYLLKIRKFTIKGARERLKNGQQEVEQEVQLRETLLKVRAFLLELKDALQ